MQVSRRSIRFTQQAAFLLDLQGTLTRREPVRSAAHHEQRPLIVEGIRNLRHVQVLFPEKLGGRVRQRADRGPEFVRLVHPQRAGGDAHLKRQHIQHHQTRGQHGHGRTAALTRRKADGLIAECLKGAASRVGEGHRQDSVGARVPCRVDGLGGRPGSRLHDDRCRFVPFSPVMRELQRVVAFGRPPSPLPADEGSELGTVKRGPAPGEHQVPNALIDQPMRQRRQLGPQVQHLPHQLRLCAEIFDQQKRVSLSDFRCLTNTSPERDTG